MKHKRIKQCLHWTESEVARLKKLRREGKAWDVVMQQLPGRTKGQCQSRIHYEQFVKGGIPHEKNMGFRAPPDVVAEARTRAALCHPTLTAQFCGDPLPGYSALDRPRPKPRITLPGRFSSP